jgi:lipooligosaccharide transport system permease protein
MAVPAEVDQVSVRTPAPIAPNARASLALRIIPPGLYAGRAHVVLERAFRVYRRSWMLIFSGFFEPLFYLFALGTGLHRLVGTVLGPGGHVLTYTEFIAPALLASSAMNGAVYDSTMNVFFKLKHAKLYDSMLATSLGPLDVAMGEINWALIRGGLYAAGFLVVMVVLNLTASWWAVLMLPAALLIAFAFGALGMAVTSYMKSFQDLDLVQLAVLPMFLFSGTFYGLSVYPAWLRIVVECLPLQHGIALLRGLNAGVLDLGMLGHVAYFVVMAAVGLVVTTRRLDALLMR